ncbi:hypothetical protein, partial [Stenotrophomonas sp. BIIR7]|uniref:hypothetical protein n=1 Tax=Stenotrophomonas sp. BIIR7 TaxID=1904462 RepID=UPI001C40162B
SASVATGNADADHFHASTNADDFTAVVWEPSLPRGIRMPLRMTLSIAGRVAPQPTADNSPTSDGALQTSEPPASARAIHAKNGKKKMALHN